MCFSLLACAPCLVCCAPVAYKTNKAVSKAFDRPASEPAESALSTELKLKWKLWNAAPGQKEPPTRDAPKKVTRSLSVKETESKQRLQQLIDENRGGPSRSKFTK